ncbi:MAG: aminotransferase class I/II-fold pyridoxal phosphate-dependent enzyme [Anaeromyxobacteraceae bacterium]|nr:aminotransferase class I/II-fold pyridoxal phosphate-dependent enzyme [Anaeromyxobacteraceae bacterium]
MTPIDLRSDTVTTPTEAMRAAMARAEVGDDVFGEDPTVNRLQEVVAGLLGKEAGLFVPSGTMANQLALGALTRPGDEIICDAQAHCISFEGGALAALWGVQPRALAAPRGLLDAAAVEAAIRPAADHYPRTRVIEVENTHNRGGGAVYPLPQLQALGALARARGLDLYMDGARLWNACAATGIAPATWAAEATLVSTCLSKGLGAPVGSVLCGPRALVAEARRLRKRLGGGMRQAGVLAAAGLHALEHHRERLRDDHENARALGEAVANLPGARLLHPVDTNLVFAVFEGRSAADLARRFGEAGVRCLPEGSRPDLIRFITHLHVTRADVEEAARRMAKVLAAG